MGDLPRMAKRVAPFRKGALHSWFTFVESQFWDWRPCRHIMCSGTARQLVFDTRSLCLVLMTSPQLHFRWPTTSAGPSRGRLVASALVIVFLCVRPKPLEACRFAEEKASRFGIALVNAAGDERARGTHCNQFEQHGTVAHGTARFHVNFSTDARGIGASNDVAVHGYSKSRVSCRIRPLSTGIGPLYQKLHKMRVFPQNYFVSRRTNRQDIPSWIEWFSSVSVRRACHCVLVVGLESRWVVPNLWLFFQTFCDIFIF